MKEEAELEPDVRFYQRLVGRDRDGAIAVVEAELKRSPRVEVFDSVLVPALSRAEHDAARDELDEPMQAFIWGVVGEILDTLEGVPDFSLAALAVPAGGGVGSADIEWVRQPIPILGLVADDNSDALVLRMLGQLLPTSDCNMQIVTDTETSLQIVERVADQSPALVVVSHLPPEGSTLARYLVRRLRAHFADLPILVGRWEETEGPATAVERLVVVGASHVVSTLADARTHVLSMVVRKRKSETVATAVSA